VTGTTDNGGENGTRSIISGKSGLTEEKRRKERTSGTCQTWAMRKGASAKQREAA